MADSAFWRELASQFLLIPDYRGELRADGYYALRSDETWIWKLRGGATDFIYHSFESLARKAATGIATAGAPDLLTLWLEGLRRGQFNFRYTGEAAEIQTDGQRRDNVSPWHD
jgi:hypothetical protein